MILLFSSKRSFVFAWPTLFHDSSLSKENKPPLKIKILFDKTPKLRRQCIQKGLLGKKGYLFRPKYSQFYRTQGGLMLFLYQPQPNVLVSRKFVTKYFCSDTISPSQVSTLLSHFIPQVDIKSNENCLFLEQDWIQGRKSSNNPPPLSLPKNIEKEHLV